VTAWLRLLPPWLWWLMALMVVAGAQQWRVAGLQDDLTRLQTDWATERADLASQAAESERNARAEEQRRQTAIEGIRRDAQEQIAAVAADAAAADDAASRLRARVAKLSRRPAICAGSSGGGQATDPARDLFAVMLSRLDEASGGIAEFADRSRAAGLTCQSSYESLDARHSSAN